MNSDVVLGLCGLGLFMVTSTALVVRTLVYDAKQRKKSTWYKKKVETGSFIKEVMDLFEKGERQCLVSKKEMKITTKTVPMYIETDGTVVTIKMAPHSDLKMRKETEGIKIDHADILNKDIKLYQPALKELYDKVLQTYCDIYGDNSKQLQSLIHKFKNTYSSVTELHRIHKIEYGPFTMKLLKHAKGKIVTLSIKEQEIWTYETINEKSAATEKEGVNDFLLGSKEKKALEQLKKVVKDEMINEQKAINDRVLERIKKLDAQSNEKYTLQQAYEKLHERTKSKKKAELHNVLNTLETKIQLHD